MPIPLRMLLVFLLLGAPPLSAEDDRQAATEPAPAKPLEVIQAKDAAAHATETAIVEFTVHSSNQIRDRNGRPMVFLNSHRDYRDEENFTVVIFSSGLANFRKAEIDQPAKHYRDQKVRVRGGIELRRGKPQITLKDPQAISIVKPKPAAERAVNERP